MPTTPPDVRPNEHWAYQVNAGTRAVEVRVLSVGTKKPLRVKVRFVDDAFEGREDWVPPNRLKVLWSEAGKWQLRHDRWRSVTNASRSSYDTTGSWAANTVLAAWEELGEAEIYFGYGTGVLTVTDLDALARGLGLDREWFINKPLSFIDDDGKYVGPWPVAEELAQLMAVGLANSLLKRIFEDEKQFQKRAVSGDDIKLGRNEYRYVTPERCIELDEPWRRANDLVRSWCGVDAVERADELQALRSEIARVRQISEGAIIELIRAGAPQEAGRLAKELGVSVDVLRARLK